MCKVCVYYMKNFQRPLHSCFYFFQFFPCFTVPIPDTYWSLRRIWHYRVQLCLQQKASFHSSQADQESFAVPFWWGEKGAENSCSILFCIKHVFEIPWRKPVSFIGPVTYKVEHSLPKTSHYCYCIPTLLQQVNHHYAGIIIHRFDCILKSAFSSYLHWSSKITVYSFFLLPFHLVSVHILRHFSLCKFHNLFPFLNFFLKICLPLTFPFLYPVYYITLCNSFIVHSISFLFHKQIIQQVQFILLFYTKCCTFRSNCSYQSWSKCNWHCILCRNMRMRYKFLWRYVQGFLWRSFPQVPLTFTQWNFSYPLFLRLFQFLCFHQLVLLHVSLDYH